MDTNDANDEHDELTDADDVLDESMDDETDYRERAATKLDQIAQQVKQLWMSRAGIAACLPRPPQWGCRRHVWYCWFRRRRMGSSGCCRRLGCAPSGRLGWVAVQKVACATTGDWDMRRSGIASNAIA